MILVKLNATNSTSTYLKELSKNDDIKSWTVVAAEFQNSGRGQQETKWVSEKGKNLICSILIQFNDLKIEDQFYLNCAISLGIFTAISRYEIPNLKIKWPNDIMSASKKMGGILVENTLKANLIYQSVVGIGLNINQDEFPNDLPKAISMKQILNDEIDRAELLNNIVRSLKKQIEILNNKKFELLHKNYENELFKIGKVHTFEDSKMKKFVGKLLGVSKQGQLLVELEDETIKYFGFKEIKFL